MGDKNRKCAENKIACTSASSDVSFVSLAPVHRSWRSPPISVAVRTFTVGGVFEKIRPPRSEPKNEDWRHQGVVSETLQTYRIHQGFGANAGVVRVVVQQLQRSSQNFIHSKASYITRASGPICIHMAMNLPHVCRVKKPLSHQEETPTFPRCWFRERICHDSPPQIFRTLRRTEFSGEILREDSRIHAPASTAATPGLSLHHPRRLFANAPARPILASSCYPPIYRPFGCGALLAGDGEDTMGTLICDSRTTARRTGDAGLVNGARSLCTGADQLRCPNSAAARADVRVAAKSLR
ncbi:hypothetical protein DFH09DRAFT_1089353 [Mycena vulgaris]|nr:hypothetical protein DFH09DRAFT_1089353 [Mycena vulgaris]